MGPWHFNSLSGQSQIKSLDQLKSLTKNLESFEPLSFWNEPIESTNGGPEFFERVSKILLTKNHDFNDAETLSKLSECLVALFGTVTLSGNHDLMLEALTTMISFNNQNDDADKVFKLVEGRMSQFIK